MEDCNICCEPLKRGHIFKIHKATNGEYHKCCTACAKKCLLSKEDDATCPFCREKLLFEYPNTRGKEFGETVIKSMNIILSLNYASYVDVIKSRRIIYEYITVTFNNIKYNYLFDEQIGALIDAANIWLERIPQEQMNDIPIDQRIELTSFFVALLQFKKHIKNN